MFHLGELFRRSSTSASASFWLTDGRVVSSWRGVRGWLLYYLPVDRLGLMDSGISNHGWRAPTSELGITYLGSQGDVWDAQKTRRGAHGACSRDNFAVARVVEGVPGPRPSRSSSIHPCEMMVERSDLSWAESRSSHLASALLLCYGLLWTWLAIAPVNRRDWLLENLLAFALVVLLVLTYRQFQFSDVSYGLIACFMTLHAVGAHYTYAEVPFGFWLKDLFSLSRNPFDRIVHFAYGALLAYPVREALIRLAGVRGVGSYYLPASLILAQSGLFEIIESVVAAFVSQNSAARISARRATSGMRRRTWHQPLAAPRWP